MYIIRFFYENLAAVLVEDYKLSRNRPKESRLATANPSSKRLWCSICPRKDDKKSNIKFSKCSNFISEDHFHSIVTYLSCINDWTIDLECMRDKLECETISGLSFAECFISY